jgi:hypothetical protein
VIGSRYTVYRPHSNNFPNDGLTGKSAYDHNSYGANTLKGTPTAVELSFDRPYNDDGAGQIFDWEHDLIRYLEQQGYDVTYTTDVDTHAHPERLQDVRGFMSTGHDEYWSGAMFDGIEAARNAGVNLAFFGANAAWWQVRMQPSTGGVPNRVMVIYKDYNLDPEPNPLKKTVLFRTIGRPAQRLLGIQYLDWNTWGMNTAFVVQDTSHWIYNGSGFSTGDVIPGIIGYEIDARLPDYLLPDSVGYTVLGHSPYTGLINGNVNADTVIYETSRGSQVFSSGSICWSWGLNRTGYINPGIRAMTKNLLDRFVGPAPVPTAPAVTNPGTQNSEVGKVISLPVTANDPQGDPLTFSAEGLPAGLGISANGGLISGTVDAAAIGSHTVSVHVTDGTQTSTINFIWVITAAPELANCGAPTYNPNADAYLFIWKECGSDNWHVRLTGGGTSYIQFSGTVESTTGFITVINDGAELSGGDVIDTSDPNAIKFSFTTGDIYNDGLMFIPQIGTQLCFKRTATTTQVRVGNGASITVPPFDPTTSQACYQLNTAPVVTNPGPQLSVENSTVSLAIVASDAQNNLLTYVADNLPPGLDIDAGTGVISGTLGGKSLDPYNVSVHVSDGSLITTVDFSWRVYAPNTAPHVTDPDEQTSSEGDVISLGILAHDDEGNTLGYTASGLPPGLGIDPDTGVISGTVGGSSNEPYNVSVHVSDGSLITTVDFSWTVNAPNTAPQVINPGTQISTEGDVISLQVNASDGGDDTLTYTADGMPPGLGIDPDSGLISGTVGGASGTPYSAQVHVSNDSLTTTVDFDWTVNTNNAPTVYSPDDQVSTEGDVISLGIVASDDGGNPLGYTADNLPSGLTINAGTGLISGTVGGASVTPYSVSVHVSDGSLSSTVDFSWTVNAVIQPDGDVNEDGIVDVADLLLAQRALLGQITLTTDQLLHADVAPLLSGIPDPDGFYNLGDVLVIERKVLGLIDF